VFLIMATGGDRKRNGGGAADQMGGNEINRLGGESKAKARVAAPLKKVKALQPERVALLADVKFKTQRTHFCQASEAGIII
jgi:hypothetical protein